MLLTVNTFILIADDLNGGHSTQQQPYLAVKAARQS
jgi:hypothetical protein